MVDDIIEQKTHDYTDNLRLLKPNYVVHADDWIEGQSVVRINHYYLNLMIN